MLRRDAQLKDAGSALLLDKVAVADKVVSF